MLSNTKTKNHT